MLGKIAFQLAHSKNRSCLPQTDGRLCLLSDVMSDPILGRGALKLLKKFNNNQNVTGKINSISENLTKIKVSFDFTGFLMSHTQNLCTCIENKTWGCTWWSRCAKYLANMICLLSSFDLTHSNSNYNKRIKQSFPCINQARV